LVAVVYEVAPLVFGNLHLCLARGRYDMSSYDVSGIKIAENWVVDAADNITTSNPYQITEIDKEMYMICIP
jgi:hypothetical protein